MYCEIQCTPAKEKGYESVSVTGVGLLWFEACGVDPPNVTKMKVADFARKILI